MSARKDRRSQIAVLCLAIFALATAAGPLRADSFNWNNLVVSGSSYSFVPPVASQGAGNTCWAFSTIDALEAMYEITAAIQPSPCRSPRNNWSMPVRKAAMRPMAATSAQPWRIATTGVVNAQTCPYLSATTATNGPPGWTMPSAWAGMLVKADSYSGPILGSTDTIKADLKKYGPMVVTLQVDNDFYSPSTGTRTGLSHALLVTDIRTTRRAGGG